MQFRYLAVMFAVGIAGCNSSNAPASYSVYFPPYSAQLDDQAQAAAQDAAHYALEHPRARVLLSGYSAPPDPGKDVEGLSNQRTQAVRQVLVRTGVNPDRIETQANGITDPKTMPNVSVRRVDISFIR